MVAFMEMIVNLLDMLVASIPSGLLKTLILLFGLSVFAVILQHPRMFMKSHGRVHTTLGMLYLVWITAGFAREFWGNASTYQLQFHTILGLLGISLTAAAAMEFKHKNVRNVASGTLDKHATVTYNEMIEHIFYQVLNLIQILYFHNISPADSLPHRVLLVYLVSMPWLVRDLFPVNKFSDNYTQIDERSTQLIRNLYRIKKYQYVFYKHFVLHGLNISVAIYRYELVSDASFRLFWLFLNASYVMEFFLQTLVKKNYLSQSFMLVLQHVLMLASSIAAVSVLRKVDLFVAMASLALNFVNRKHDVTNTMVIMVTVVWVKVHILLDTSIV